MKPSLAQLNQALEEGGELPEWVMMEWLWKTEPEEKFSPEVLLNRNQLLGLLVCRHKSFQSLSGTGAGPDRLVLMDKPVQRMTLREWKDTTTNLQIEWPQFLERLKNNPRAEQNLQATRVLIEGLAARFGALAGGVFGEDVLNDVSDTEPREEDGQLVLTMGAIRRGLGVLLVMHRHLYLLGACVELPREDRDVGVNKFHHEASMQTFHTWYMHFKLPVAAKLVYRHDFPGMYNHVSQPAFFHNPDFARVKRLLWSDEGVPAIHVLPSICQLYPTIPVRFEEECLNPTENQGWYWLLVAGRVYLVTPQPSVVYSEDATAMLGFYLDAQALMRE